MVKTDPQDFRNEAVALRHNLNWSEIEHCVDIHLFQETHHYWINTLGSNRTVLGE